MTSPNDAQGEGVKLEAHICFVRDRQSYRL